ncbi:hypothetical protein BU15DRAFT_69325 [Melanogaster broomeanus]|nr:hypothetical protein BU15DRAFT_69325 [Melanogaster broomeanus]
MLVPLRPYGKETSNHSLLLHSLPQLWTGNEFTSCCVTHCRPPAINTWCKYNSMLKITFRDVDDSLRRKLLEFEVCGDSGSFSGPVSVDIPVLEGEIINGMSRQWPYLCINGSCRGLVWDMRTRIFHKLPHFSSALHICWSRGGFPRLRPVQVVAAESHIIAVYHWSGRRGNAAIFQAFVFANSPRPASDGIYDLRLTHETSTETEYCRSTLHLLRNSVFDPVTRATSLRILSFLDSEKHMEHTCLDFTLPELQPTRLVVPMTIHTQPLFTFTFKSEGVMNEYWITSSDDGHLRGICRALALGNDRGLSARAHFIRKFSIDASKEICVAALGNICQAAPTHSIPYTGKKGSCAFDGFSGRMHHTDWQTRRHLVATDFE